MFKHNTAAIIAYVLSLILPFGMVISYSYKTIYETKIIYTIGQLIVLIGLASSVASLVAFGFAISYNNLCIKKYKILSTLSLVILLFSMMGTFISRILKPIDSSTCGSNTWCSNINTTISMNWNDNTYQPWKNTKNMV